MPKEIGELVDRQAEDEGLWFIAQTAPEAYLQAALRELHAAVESNKTVHVAFRCDHDHPNNPCSKEPQYWSAHCKPHQIALFALWFHAHHEGHKFSYWEDGELVLGEG